MVQRLTWIKVADSSQAQWLKTFHLYGGFNQKVARCGGYIKGSVRIIQAIPDPYKGFIVKRINKGRVTRAIVVRQAYKFKLKSGSTVISSTNDGVLLKDDKSILIKHVIGPCFTLVRNKRILNLFKKSI